MINKIDNKKWLKDKHPLFFVFFEKHSRLIHTELLAKFRSYLTKLNEEESKQAISGYQQWIGNEIINIRIKVDEKPSNRKAVKELDYLEEAYSNSRLKHFFNNDYVLEDKVFKTQKNENMFNELVAFFEDRGHKINKNTMHYLIHHIAKYYNNNNPKLFYNYINKHYALDIKRKRSIDNLNVNLDRHNSDLKDFENEYNYRNPNNHIKFII